MLDKTNGFVIHSSSLAVHQNSVLQANWSLKLKGRERRKSQRAIIFGKENKRRTKKIGSEKMSGDVIITLFNYLFFTFERSTFLK